MRIVVSLAHSFILMHFIATQWSYHFKVCRSKALTIRPAASWRGSKVQQAYKQIFSQMNKCTFFIQFENCVHPINRSVLSKEKLSNVFVFIFMAISDKESDLIRAKQQVHLLLFITWKTSTQLCILSKTSVSDIGLRNVRPTPHLHLSDILRVTLIPFEWPEGFSLRSKSGLLTGVSTSLLFDPWSNGMFKAIAMFPSPVLSQISHFLPWHLWW